MEQIKLMRGRTPLVATHRQYYIEVVGMSRAGVKYRKYIKVIDIISPTQNDKTGRTKNEDSVNIGES